VVRGHLRVVWDKEAKNQLKDIFRYIQKDFVQNVEMLKNAILSQTASLATHPLRYPADKLKEDNYGSYRAFIKYHYRVAYRVLEGEIRILRVRSDKQEPLSY